LFAALNIQRGEQCDLFELIPINRLDLIIREVCLLLKSLGAAAGDVPGTSDFQNIFAGSSAASL